MKSAKIDKLFLSSVIILAITGFFIFSSASLGLLARNGPEFNSIATVQGIGLILGFICMAITAHVNYHAWRKYAFYLFLASIILNVIIFIPGLGIEHGGAKRWLDIGPISFQPSEFLKIGFIIYFAAWLSGVKDKVSQFRYGLLPLLVIIGILAPILYKQTDTKTIVIIFIAGLAMLIVSGARWKDIIILGLISVAVLGIVAYNRPYIRERLNTFINPAENPQGSGYQIQQSLIAIGSGQMFGRGFGQSVQKFNFLPEPIGDSIFAVQAEEFGFVGSLLLIGFFLFFAFRALKIASRSADQFGGLLVVGIVILVVSESFMNIASMLGVMPLSGMPLLFVSHGGTALLLVLAEVGIILNVSKYQK
ncbi:cell division protein FtsW [Patescibacteria group bacterium]|nr:MAG: cell division protein FtsW [Patescibacteria group bacterium]